MDEEGEGPELLGEVKDIEVGDTQTSEQAVAKPLDRTSR